MKTAVTVVATCLALSGVAHADLEPYEDYDFSKQVTSITTVKVDANMFDVYLEGLQQTWVASNRLSKELGQIEDYAIYVSELPASGEFNLVLVITYESSAQAEPTKEKYDAFMAKWGAERDERNEEIAKTYPNVRTITGEYRLREVELK